MAGASLLLLLDDIASVLDDVALMAKVAAKNSAGALDDVAGMTKVAAKNTAGVLGDDLALNAQQVSGVVAERELPVVWAVAKGSLVNKLILIPAALVISALAPWLILPLLMIGGAYLCFEGAEKVLHTLFPPSEHTGEEGHVSTAAHAGHPEPQALASAEPEIDFAAQEKAKIKGAVRTDFVLSAEIIVIALGTVPEGSSFPLRAAVLSLVGLLMTVGVYGFVACIVKLDDAGFYLIRKHPEGGVRQWLGKVLVGTAPRLMRLLTVVGTVAMFLVGGSILDHGLPFAHALTVVLEAWPAPWLWGLLFHAGLGLTAGALLVGGMKLLPKKA